jgi:hypothetical protein
MFLYPFLSMSMFFFCNCEDLRMLETLSLRFHRSWVEVRLELLVASHYFSRSFVLARSGVLSMLISSLQRNLDLSTTRIRGSPILLHRQDPFGLGNIGYAHVFVAAHLGLEYTRTSCTSENV